MFFIKHIKNYEHYDFLINDVVKNAKKYVWIGTADIKDLHCSLSSTKRAVPFLNLLNDLIAKSIHVRLLHAKEPGKNFIRSYDKYPLLVKNMERSLCIRVHFKIIIVDGSLIYTGSANLTGAAFGMRSTNSRNFESGIVTNDPEIVESTIEQFDSVWRGDYCEKCKLKNICPDVIDG